MLRGLISKWKQLLYYNFDTDMSKELILDIIMKVEAAGFLVVAMVCDMGPTNVRLWNSLGVGVDKCSFQNPASNDRQIFVFADAPHLLKLVRNNFLDHGFKLDGSKGCKSVDSTCVREVVKRSTKDLKLTFRLDDRHIEVHGTKRMNVCLAAQLLSETTAKSLQYLGGRGLLKSDNWEETSKFIMLVDSWFDLFNSRSPYGKKASRDAYGQHLTEQNALLENMIKTAKTMRVNEKQHLFQFQKGLITSCQSLSKLYEMLTAKYHVSYIMTHRLNQDCLEHFFGCVRQMDGNYEHPCPVTVKNRIKKYLLGRETDLMSQKSNVEKDCDAKKLVYPLLAKDTPKTECNMNKDTEDDHEKLDHELTLSAMIFASDCNDTSILDCDEPASCDIQGIQLEDVVEKEALRYVGGFIVRKFPQYEFLGSNVQEGDHTWVGTVSRHVGKLKQPSNKFYEQLQRMEKMFISYQGNEELRAEKHFVQNIKNIMKYLVPLPEDVIEYFVRCRLFFRLRILNRKIMDKRGAMRKMAKLVTGGKTSNPKKSGKQDE